jgi:hypothetical protein
VFSPDTLSLSPGLRLSGGGDNASVVNLSADSADANPTRDIQISGDISQTVGAVFTINVNANLTLGGSVTASAGSVVLAVAENIEMVLNSADAATITGVISGAGKVEKNCR